MYLDRQTLANSVQQAECSIWSESILFATHSAILHPLTGSKMDAEEKYKVKSKGVTI